MSETPGLPELPPAWRAKIRPHHRRRSAELYVRQSSRAQMKQHTGSAAHQRSLVELPKLLGWADEQIHVIDSDQGRSAKGDVRRTGFEALLDRINAGTVGIVIVHDLSRLSRRPDETMQLFWATKKNRTLIYYSDTLEDPANDSVMELFGLQIKGMLGWVDNANRAATAMAAKIAKAHERKPTTRPPIGYVRDATTERWIKDDRPGVQAAIDRIFALFLELRSLGKVKRHLKEHELLFPHRVGKEIQWRGVDEAQLHALLHHQAYVGDYHFRYKARPGDANPSDDDDDLQREIVHRDNHPPYVSREDSQAIQDILTANRPMIRPILGKGSSVLQGLLRSPVTRKLFVTKYWAKDRTARTGRYVVRQIDDWGDDRHYVAIPARLVDHAVTRRVLKEVRAPELQLAIAALQKRDTNTQTREQDWKRAFEEAQRAVDRAAHAVEVVGDNDREVRDEVVARLKQAVKERNRLEAAKPIPVPPVRKLTGVELKELGRYCKDIDALWNDPGTTNAERKELLRVFLSEILVLNTDPEFVLLKLVWRHREPEELSVLRPPGVAAFAIRRKEEGVDASAITAELAAQEVITATGQPISVNVVRQKLGRVGLRTKSAWLVAVKMIREDVLAKTPRAAMLCRLNAEAPAELGPWDSRRLSDVIRRLRAGVYGLEPLPAVLPAEEEERRVLAAIEEQRLLERSWAQIADHLNANGYQPQRTGRFTRALVYSLYRRAQARGA